jgi:cobalt-precorrin-5B (C1)-methyltransferase
VDVALTVPDGKNLALKTFNPRLGIEGGISILGTRGTVRPFSHAAWRGTVAQCLDVARAEGRYVAALSTGSLGQKYLETALGTRPGIAFVQAGDHVGFALRGAARRGFSAVVWGGLWGKLLKIAQGRPQTHARLFTINLQALANLAAGCTVKPDIIASVTRANTARHALEILRRSPDFEKILQTVMRSALKYCRIWAGPGPDLGLILFDYDGREMTRLTGCRQPRNIDLALNKHDNKPWQR